MQTFWSIIVTIQRIVAGNTSDRVSALGNLLLRGSRRWRGAVCRSDISLAGLCLGFQCRGASGVLCVGWPIRATATKEVLERVHNTRFFRFRRTLDARMAWQVFTQKRRKQFIIHTHYIVLIVSMTLLCQFVIYLHTWTSVSIFITKFVLRDLESELFTNDGTELSALTSLFKINKWKPNDTCDHFHLIRNKK